MNKKLFTELEEQVLDALVKKNVKKALSTLQSMLYLLPDGELEDKCVALRNAYEGMLNCLKRGIKDSTREQSFLSMLENTIQIFFEISYKFRLTQTEGLYTKTYGTVEHDLPFSSFQLGLEHFGQQVITKQDAPHFKAHEQNYVDLFNKIWTYGRLSKEDYEDLCALMDSPDIFLNDKMLIISAMFLSAQEYPDHLKFQFLVKYVQSEVPEIQMRAFVSLTLISLQMQMQKGAVFSADLQPFYDWIKQDSLQQDRLILLIQYLWDALTAREFVEKIDAQLTPNTQKYVALIQEIEQLKDDPDAELKTSSMLSRLKDMTDKIKKLQDSGKDLHLSTFGRFKFSKFFLYLPNWFYPFTWHHSLSYPVLEKDDSGIMRLFVNQNRLCDSDKWSALCIIQKAKVENVNIPQQDLHQLIRTEDKSWSTLCCDYVHDLFRFYKMYVFRSFFTDIFKDNLNPRHKQDLWQALDTNHQNMMAKVLYDHNQYTEAISIFQRTQPKKEVYCKALAHSYQQIGLYAQAIDWYERINYSETDKWMRKQLATCYGQSGEIQKAISLLQELCEIDPKNETRYNMQSAKYLIDLKDYQQALNLLHKIEYFAENDPKAIRAITWCYLLTNRPDKAKQYWHKLKDTQTEDWLNAGHIYWALKDEQNAHACYWKYMQQMANDDKAIDQFNKDRNLLYQYGISDTDILLMLQALQD